ncbi:MAG: hypothetical protein V4663_13330 [Bacteroidota bacterium]
MAIQQGIISLSGKVGDLIFSNRKGKHIAKKKSLVPMNQTEATKKSSSDFGVASKAAARLRRSFAPFIEKYGDTTLVSRFTKHMLKVFKTIPADFIGHKQLNQGDVGIFKDFQFNASARLDSLLFQLPKVEIAASGLKIVFKAYKESLIGGLFKRVAKADTALLKLMVYNLNLDNNDDEVVSIKELGIPSNNESFRGATVQIPLNFIGQQVVFVAVGIHYEGKNSMIGDKTKRAAAIVHVARLNDGVEVAFVPQPQAPHETKDDNEGLDWVML